MNNVDGIPSNYIMNRWTKGVACTIFTSEVAYRVRSHKSIRSFEVKKTLEELHDMCELSNDIFEYVKECIKSTKHKFRDILDGIAANETREEDNNYLQDNQSLQLHDPNVSQTKGRKRALKGTATRIQSGLEEASNSTGRCSACQKGGHNKRKCPLLRNCL